MYIYTYIRIYTLPWRGCSAYSIACTRSTSGSAAASAKRRRPAFMFILITCSKTVLLCMRAVCGWACTALDVCSIACMRVYAAVFGDFLERVVCAWACL